MNGALDFSPADVDALPIDPEPAQQPATGDLYDLVGQRLPAAELAALRSQHPEKTIEARQVGDYVVITAIYPAGAQLWTAPSGRRYVATPTPGALTATTNADKPALPRELWLAGLPTLAAAMQAVNKKISTFTTIIENDNSCKSRAFFTDSDFAPPLYNLWTFAKKTNNVSLPPVRKSRLCSISENVSDLEKSREFSHDSEFTPTPATTPP